MYTKKINLNDFFTCHECKPGRHFLSNCSPSTLSTVHWIVLKARADWLVKLRISCAIYLRAIREKMASRFAMIRDK